MRAEQKEMKSRRRECKAWELGMIWARMDIHEERKNPECVPNVKALTGMCRGKNDTGESSVVSPKKF